MEALEILKDNYYSRNNSFIYFPHEESMFYKKSFWEYYDCLCELGQLSNEEKFTQEILILIHFAHRYTVESILYHFAPNDLYRIKYFPRTNYIYYLDRLDFAMDAFYQGYAIDKVDFGNYIKRPKDKGNRK